MMIKAELIKTIDWLKEFVHRLKDREDYEALKEHTDHLDRKIRELEERRDAL